MPRWQTGRALTLETANSWPLAPRTANLIGDHAPGTGAANRTRTCDPVITNDVLYQLSYCGGPCGAVGVRCRKRPHLISGSARFGKKNAAARRPRTASGAISRREPGPAPDPVRGMPWIASGARFRPKTGRSAAPAGQETAPAAGLALGGVDLFRKLIDGGLVVDPGIVGRADDGDHRRDAG